MKTYVENVTDTPFTENVGLINVKFPTVMG
jgi:hypothetical protein